jgi:hypothetical protein
VGEKRVQHLRLLPRGHRLQFLLRDRDRPTRRVRLAGSKHLDAIVGDQQGVFELSAPLAIDGGGGPVVGPSLIAPASQIHHGFDRETHTLFSDADSLVFGVVGHVGCAVEQLVDAVAAVGADDATPAGLGQRLDHVAGVAEEHARFYELNGGVEAVAGGLDDADGGGVRRADVVGFVQVAVEAVVVQGYVDVDDVAVLQRTRVGDAVADHLVDRRADGLRELAVVQR